MICGLIGNLLEDLPQLAIQLTAVSQSINTFTVLSIVASVLTLFFGITKRAILFLIYRLGGEGKAQREREKKGEKAAFQTDSDVGLSVFSS